ncbi:MAG: 2-hydroxy-3-oxopropionate reductase, partial [Chloroflexi bacterium]|nr:2-hydroxy-3-oxopropionate reductase [Chloroflexota bacterium]
MTDVGLVGMGVIGRIYAVNLLKAYQQIRVYDIDQEKAGA